MSAFIVLLLLAACEDDAERSAPEAPPDPPPTAAPLAPLFPLHPGDRWRRVADDGMVRLEGVTGVDASGIAAVHGTGHTQAERFVQAGDEVRLVSPDGAALSPVLRSPLRTGERFEYQHTERDVAVPCEVEVVATDGRATVAGSDLTGCVSLHRRCRYPAGAPFPTETTHVREETYCPSVGLVLERSVFRPPPTRSAIPADRTERLVGFRVDGGPPPAESGCERYILLPNDVAAACGSDVAPEDGVGSAMPDGACRYGYRHGTAILEAVIGASAEAAPADALIDVDSGGRRAWISGEAAACPGAERLAPLLASLLG